MLRNWKSLDNNATQGQSLLHKIGWQPVMVKRIQDYAPNVGIDSEYSPEIVTFEIQARIDPYNDRTGKELCIGLVEPHILPMMAKGDHWLTQQPNGEVNEFKVISIIKDEILLEQI